MRINQSNTYQAMWLGIGSLSTFTLSIVSAAILSRYFDKTEYGTYRQILYVYNTLLIIFTAGLPKVFAYFLPRYSLEEGKDIVWKISKLLFLFGLLFSVVLFTGSNLIAKILNNPDLSIGLKYFSPIPMLLLPTLGIEGIFSTYKKTLFIAIYNTTSRLLMLLFIVLPVILLKGTYLYAIYGWLTVSLITLFMAYFFKEIPFKHVNKKIAPLKLKEIFKYSIPLVGASLAGLAIRSADQYYISRYFGAAVFAEYANGFIQIPLVAMVTGATSTILMPQFSKMIQEKEDISKIANLWQSAMIKSAILIYPIVVFFIFHAKAIIIILFSNRYENSAIYFQIAMIANFFNIIAIHPILFSLGETKYYSQIHVIGAFLSWILGYLIVSNFARPEFIAILSIAITIFIIVSNLYKVTILLRLSFRELIPITFIFKIILQSIIVISLIILVRLLLNINQMHIITILLSFLFYLFLLIISSKLFNINYLQVIKPFIK